LNQETPIWRFFQNKIKNDANSIWGNYLFSSLH